MTSFTSKSVICYLVIAFYATKVIDEDGNKRLKQLSCRES